MSEKQSPTDLLLNSPLRGSELDLSRSKKKTGRETLQFSDEDKVASEIRESLRGRKFSDSADLLREDRER